MSLFTRYREVEKRSGAWLNADWQFFKGGYIHLGRNNWTFLQRFKVKGQAMFGTEKEFVLRGQIALDREPRFSWFTFEFVNPFEARLVYIWIKIWPGYNVHAVFNAGWRLTMESKKYLQNQVAEHERKAFKEMRKNAQAVKNNGGVNHAGIPR